MSIIGMRNKMSKWGKGLMLLLAVTFVVGVIGMTLSGKLGGPGASKREVGVLAKVNGEKLLWKDFQSILQKQQKQYEDAGQQVTPAVEIQIRGSIFDQMVDEALKVQAADKEGISVSRGDIAKKVDEYTDMQMKSLREQALRGKKKKTDAVFEAQLAKMEPGMTIEKKRRAIHDEIAGFSDEIRKGLLIEKLDKKVTDSVSVSEKAVQESYDEAKLSQITVGVTGKRSDEQAKKRADEIAAKLKKGDDFAAIAKQSSDDMYKTYGGNRGPVRKAYLEPELRDVAFKLKAGDVSDPVKTSQGYVILKSAGVTRNLPSDFNDPKKKREYRDMYAQQERDRAKYEYYDKLKKDMKLDVFDSEMKAYVAFKDAYQSMMAMSEGERKHTMEKIIKLYQDALSSSDEQTDIKARCYIQLGSLYNLMKSSPMFGLKKADQVKYAQATREAIENALVYTEDVSLRMTAAQLAFEAKDYKAAQEHLALASDNSYDETQTHEQIRDMYKKMNRQDLAAKEQKWIDDYKKEQAANGTTAQPATSQPITVPAGK